MVDKRHKNVNWQLPTKDNGGIETWQAVQIAVMMDIRDELQKLNNLLHCSNFVAIPDILRGVRKNTYRRKRKKPLRPAT